MSFQVSASQTIIVFAAASLKNVLDATTIAFEQRSGVKVSISYAGSASLARQIQLGAPADVFISANTDWVKQLETDKLIQADSQVNLASNRLVLIGHHSLKLNLNDDIDLEKILSPNGRFAIALTSSVPAGIYGRAALTYYELWKQVAPYVVETDNVRSTLRLVALGEAELGVVYSTDAKVESRVTLLRIFEDESHPPILYSAVVTSNSTSPHAADFLNWLTESDAQKLFTLHGFLIRKGSQQ
ncbi:MAG: molybdate ABC transporter substrate-binding protein [Aestuariivita sp.]|nr:molybdate ABC transporter substrate-binding protein [Aestuariivita sp.]